MTSNYFGGDRVSGGVYWSQKDMEFISVPSEGGRLGGCENDAYVKTPLWVVLLAGPAIGAGFAFLLPLFGLVVPVPFLSAKLRGATAPSIAGIAVRPPQPGLSYVEGRAPAMPPTTQADASTDSWLVQLAESIVERRIRELDAQESSR